MKNTLYIILLLVLTVAMPPAFAQEDAEIIPGDASRSNFNFYGGLLAEPSLFDGKVGLSMGATMGVTAYDNFFAGIYYVSLVSQHHRNDINYWQGTKLRGSLNHGGLIAGYIFRPEHLMNVNLNMRVGWGSIWFYDDKERNTYVLNEVFRVTRDRLVILTPGFEYSFTPINWLKVGLGMGYRMAFMVDRYEKNEFDGLVGTITIAFGSFRKNAFGEPDETSEP
jgi:hypothetical protein